LARNYREAPTLHKQVFVLRKKAMALIGYCIAPLVGERHNKPAHHPARRLKALVSSSKCLSKTSNGAMDDQLMLAVITADALVGVVKGSVVYPGLSPAVTLRALRLS
jgi:hypothetical protein